MDDDGQPMMSSGNFAVVFKMRNEQTGKLYAVKCFIKEQEGRAEAYRLIAEELEFVSSTFLTPIRYLDKELFVDTNASDETEFPVLLMDWVEGVTLDKYIREHIDDQYELSLLAYQFSRLAMWLMPQPFAHGDLKLDNILVREDGTLVLVDYDGMYVPAMKGQKARELGSPDFRHPSRMENDFDEHIDDFSLVSILLSLKAISLHPKLLERYGTSERLLFSAKDYLDLSQCNFLKEILSIGDSELNLLYGLFLLSFEKGDLKSVSFHIFSLIKPKMGNKFKFFSKGNDILPVELGLSVKWAKCNLGAKKPEDFGYYFEWGCIEPQDNSPKDSPKKTLPFFSKYNASDRKKSLDPEDDAATNLLGSPWRMPTKEEMTELKEKCNWKEECVNGVRGCRIVGPNGNSIFLPYAGSYDWGRGIPRPYKSGHGFYWSSTAYTDNYLVFENSWYLYFKNRYPSVSHYVRHCGYPIRAVIPNVTIFDENNPNTEVTQADIDYAQTDEYGVKYSWDGKRLLTAPANLKEYSIRQGTIVICDYAFDNYDYLESYKYPGLKEKEWCGELVSILIPDSVRIIGKAAFKDCWELQNIRFSKNLEEIRDEAFSNCSSIIDLILPDSVQKVGESVFEGCQKLVSISLSNSISSIEKSCFRNCRSLSFISIPEGVKSIDDFVFMECSKLTSVFFPNSLLSIGKKAFCRCTRLLSIIVPRNLKEIKEDAFIFCNGLKSISVDKRNNTFDSRENCNAIVETMSNCLLLACDSTIIPQGITIIGRYAFSSLNGRESIVLPDSLKSIGYSAFAFCKQLSSIIIPKATKMIDDSAFHGCNKLESITINGHVKLGERVFHNCDNLSSIIIPKSEQDIFMRYDYGAKLAEQSENGITLYTIRLICKNDDLQNVWTDEYGIKYSSDRKRLLKAPKDIKICRIPKETAIICNNAFNGCDSLINISFNGVRIIGCRSFADCTSLKSVNLSESIIRICDSAFEGCCNLEEISISNFTKEIGESAFANCKNLDAHVGACSVS